jgi:hypothetical protein
MKQTKPDQIANNPEIPPEQAEVVAPEIEITKKWLEEQVDKAGKAILGKITVVLEKNPSMSLLASLDGSIGEVKEKTKEVDKKIIEIPSTFRLKAKEFLSRAAVGLGLMATIHGQAEAGNETTMSKDDFAVRTSTEHHIEPSVKQTEEYKKQEASYTEWEGGYKKPEPLPNTIEGEGNKFLIQIEDTIKKNPDYFKNIKFADFEGLNDGQKMNLIAEKETEYFLTNVINIEDTAGLNLGHLISKVNIIDPKTFIIFESSYREKGIKGLNLKEEMGKVADLIPEGFLTYVDPNEINILGLHSVVIRASYKAPSNFLGIVYKLSETEGLITPEIKEAIIKAAESDLGAFIQYAPNCKGIIDDSTFMRLMSKAINRSPENARIFFEKSIDQFTSIVESDTLNQLTYEASFSNTIALLEKINFQKGYGDGKIDHNLVKALNKIVETSKGAGCFFYFYAKNRKASYKDIEGIEEDSLIAKAIDANPSIYLNYRHSIPGSFPGANLKSVQKVPEYFLDYIVDREESQFVGQERVFLIEAAIENISLTPGIISEYKHFLNEIENPKSNYVKKIKEIKNPESVYLLHDIINNNLSEEDAINITKDPDKFLPALVKIKSTPDHLGDATVENKLQDICLRSMQGINALHESPNEVRFKSLEPLGPKEIYTLIVYGEQEIYTSSFNGCFNRLINKMDSEKIDGHALLDQVGDNKFRTFVKECTGFNRLEEFLNKMNPEDANNLLRNVVKNIETTDDKLDQAVTLADIFGNAKNPETLKVLQGQVKAEFERLNSDSLSKPGDKVMYGLLSSMFRDNAIVEKDWFRGLSKEYQLEKVSGIENKDLFNENGVCIQKCRFFQNEKRDTDGIDSFNNFMKGYENDSKWKIDKSHKTFVIITGESNGRKIEIYANDPRDDSYGEEGLTAMNALLEEKKAKVMIDHYRGHSFGFKIDELSKDAKITNLGGCGGYNNLGSVLDLSPETHIVSTKGTGTRYVNDPVFKDLNDKILRGEDINWQEFWDNESKKISDERFKDYVPPHKNQGAMLYREINRVQN